MINGQRKLSVSFFSELTEEGRCGGERCAFDFFETKKVFFSSDSRHFGIFDIIMPNISIFSLFSL